MKFWITIICISTVPLLVKSQNLAQQQRAYTELLEYIDNPEDTIFIEDRYKLKKIKQKKCTGDFVLLSDSLKTGNSYEIKLETQPFDLQAHQFKTDTAWQKDGKYHVSANDTMDGQIFYGTDGTLPTKETYYFSIKINNKEIQIPKTAYSDLYEQYPCSVEAYEAKNGKYLYVYMSSSNAAGAYDVKFIFSHDLYITRILTSMKLMNGYDFMDNVRVSDEY